MKKIIGYLLVACIMCCGCNKSNDSKPSDILFRDRIDFGDTPIQLSDGRKVTLKRGAKICMEKVAVQDGMHIRQDLYTDFQWCEQISSTRANCQVHASFERPYGGYKIYRGILVMVWENGKSMDCYTKDILSE